MRNRDMTQAADRIRLGDARPAMPLQRPFPSNLTSPPPADVAGARYNQAKPVISPLPSYDRRWYGPPPRSTGL